MLCGLIGLCSRQLACIDPADNKWESTFSGTVIQTIAARMDVHDGKPDPDEDRPKRKERKVGYNYHPRPPSIVLALLLLQIT